MKRRNFLKTLSALPLMPLMAKFSPTEEFRPDTVEELEFVYRDPPSQNLILSRQNVESWEKRYREEFLSGDQWEKFEVRTVVHNSRKPLKINKLRRSNL